MSDPIPVVMRLWLDEADLRLLRAIAEKADQTLDGFTSELLRHTAAMERRIHKVG